MDNNMTRPEKCRHCVPDIKSGKITFMCGKSEDTVNEEICNKCENFKSRYIEYPIMVNYIGTTNINNSYRETDIGKPVRVRPCGDEYKNKTYIGIYLGDLFMQNAVSYHEDTKELTIIPTTNPAIFVPELKKIIYGAESWWNIISDIDNIKDITDTDIDNTWYVQLLKAMISNEQKEGKS